MPLEADTTQAHVEPPSLIDTDPAEPADKPAPAADDKKTEAPEAKAEPEAKPELTPEEKENKELSRRQRARLRDATRIASLETENRILREQGSQRQPAQAQTQADQGEPKREQFEDYESYLEARTDWRADQKVSAALKADREARQTTEQQSRQNQSQERAAQEWVKREQTFVKATEDYAEVVTPFVEEGLGSFSQTARDMIIDSEVGPQLLYALAQDDAEADRIAKLPPSRQVIALGKLEDALVTPPVKTTKAPAPIKLVVGGKSASPGYDENMTAEEFAAWGEKNGLRTFRKR